MPKYFFLSLLCLSLSTTPVFAQGVEEEKEEESGPLDNINSELHDFLNLALENGQLKLNRPHWKTLLKPQDMDAEFKAYVKRYLDRGYDKAKAERWAKSHIASRKKSNSQRLADVIIKKLGTYGRSSSRSQNFFRISFEGGVNGEFRDEKNRSFETRLEETTGRKRELHFRATNESVRITITEDAKDLFLRLSQTEKSFKIVHLDGDKKPVLVKADSFLTFYKKNYTYVEERLLPLLGQIGFGVPFTPYNREVRLSVLSALNPMTAEETKRISALIDELENDDYEAREKTQAKLAGLTMRYSSFFKTYMKSGNLGPEGRMRLRQVLSADKNLKAQVTGIVKDFRLLEDPHYLITLMEMSEKEDRPSISKSLAKLTKSDHGTDLVAWKKWAASHKPLVVVRKKVKKDDDDEDEEEEVAKKLKKDKKKRPIIILEEEVEVIKKLPKGGIIIRPKVKVVKPKKVDKKKKKVEEKQQEQRDPEVPAGKAPKNEEPKPAKPEPEETPGDDD
ncbi:MAG: hypothetical protein P1V97_06515 [Planctomycetota bacterium]|nr:hypothetical protein [Planctomycetota bacterium]